MNATTATTAPAATTPPAMVCPDCFELSAPGEIRLLDFGKVYGEFLDCPRCEVGSRPVAWADLNPPQSLAANAKP